MAVIYVKGMGNVEFPDSMSQDEIKAALDKQFASPATKASERVLQDVSGPEKAVIGYGKAVSDIGTGAKQFWNLLQQGGNVMGAQNPETQAQLQSQGQQLQQQIQETQQRDKPLNTGWGLGGQIVGGLTTTAPLMAVPGVGTVSGGAALGTVLSAIHPTAEPQKKAQELLTGGAFGMGTSAVFNAIPAVKNLIKSPFVKAYNSPMAIQARETGKKTGINFSLGQASGNSFISKLESEVLTGDKAIKFHNTQLKQATNNLINIAKKLSPNGNNPEAVGNAFNSAFRKTVDAAQRRRQFFAQRDYGAVKKMVGDAKIFSIDNLKSKLEELASQAVPGGEALTRGAGTALKTLEKMAPDGKVTFEQLRNFQSKYSSATAGKSTLFKDLNAGDTSRVGRDLLQAINQDLEKTSATVANPKISELLQKANANYTKNSRSIDRLEDSVLGTIFGKNVAFNPEKAAEKLVKMTPSEINVAKQILWRRGGKEAMDDLRSHVIYRALNKSAGSPEALASQFKINPAKVLENLPEKGSFRALFEGMTKQDLNRNISALARIADLVGRGTGGTQAIQSRAAEAGRVGTSALVGSSQSLIFGVGFLAKLFSPLGLRKILFSPEGEKILKEFSKPKIPTQALVALQQYIRNQE